MMKALGTLYMVSSRVLGSPPASTVEYTQSIYRSWQRYSGEANVDMLLKEERERLAKAQIKGRWQN